MSELYQQDWFAKWALYSPEKVAVKEFETQRTLTFGALNAFANRLARHLAEDHKLEKGDRIAVIAENCIEYIILFAAAQKGGFILVPLNYRLTSSEIDYLLKNATPKLILWEEKFADHIKAAPAFENIPFRFKIDVIAGLCAKPPRASDVFETVKCDEDDPVFILYTSGTTGFPKGAIYSHKMLFWNSINTAMSLIVNQESRSVNCMPPFHTGGWNVLVTPFLHHGAYTCMVKKFDPETVLQLIEKEGCTIFMGVPTMLKMMADLPDFEQADFSKLLYIIVGGEPLPIPLIEKWHAKGVPVRQGYGMTEVGPNLTSLHQSDAVRKKGSIGRPNFYVQIKITDEKGQPCAPNQPGELLLRGPMVTPGYWENKEATEKNLTGDWFHTGDMVREDEEGYLYVVDRIKNMYISGGENVYPAEIERIISSHPDVSEVAVVGIPDEKWGESGRAFVVKKSQTGLSESALIEFCKQHLAKFKVPKSVVFLEALPKNDTGKINKMQLKKM